MSKLLDRAKVKRENANTDYTKISFNDAYLDDCCYNLQQCIEMCLKYIVEINGERYVENHDIRAQLNILKRLNVTIPCYDELRMMSETINSWEASSRYNDNFIALIEDVNCAMECADKLIEYASSMVKTEDMKRMDVFPE
jgi:HEPN domain-containing protein